MKILMYLLIKSNSYPQQTNSGPGGYQARRPNPYAQQDDPPQYEMSHFNGNNQTNFTSPADDMSAFYDEVCTFFFMS